MKNLIVSMKHWQALQDALDPHVPLRKKPLRKIMREIKASQRPWYRRWFK